MSIFVVSLRGSKGLIMYEAGLRHHIGKGRKGKGREGPLDHVVIPMMGRFKGETVSRHHLQAVVNKTA